MKFVSREKLVFRPSQFGDGSHLILGMLAFCLFFGVRVCEAQNTISGGPQINRLVPDLQKRPAPNLLEKRSLKQRPDQDQESIASLVKSAQGEDSLIEVIVGRGKLITLQEALISAEDPKTPIVAVGDPTVLDFDILPNAQMIRILGKRVGVTDLSVITTEGKAYTFEVRVVYDMLLLRAYIRQRFPNASLRLVQMYEHVVVEGEAASTDQSYQIIETIRLFLKSAQLPRSVKSESEATPNVPSGTPPSEQPSDDNGGETPEEDEPAAPQGGIDDKPDITAVLPTPQIINLIRVPGVQQIMLEVKIAEVDRTALRRRGADWLTINSSLIAGSRIGSTNPLSDMDTGDLFGLTLGEAVTSFAILPRANLFMAFEALRTNQVINVLAEPNLMAMHGQKASFLAGGEFPVPVPQGFGGGNNNAITIQFKEFGVLLDFIPYIMDNGTIRLQVAPEVSTIDQTIGIQAAGLTVPGVNTRRANSTVELRQGQTLAMAGLLQVELEGGTNRIPLLGDLPYLGPFFSNSSHERVEKELVILVTPSFVEPMDPHQVGPLPGCEIKDPDDYEFYLLNRIENRNRNVNYRATNGWDDPFKIRYGKNGTSSGLYGSFGFSK